MQGDLSADDLGEPPSRYSPEIVLRSASLYVGGMGTKPAWRPIFGGVYEVSYRGEIRRREAAVNSDAGRVLNYRTKGSKGRQRVTLCTGGRPRSFSVHRIVAEAFLGPCPLGMTVNHKDGNPSNNHASNLEYLSFFDNEMHAQSTGLKLRGEQQVNSKLTDAKARKIWMLFDRGGVSMKELGRRYGVAVSNIHALVRGRSWKHLKLGCSKRKVFPRLTPAQVQEIRKRARAGEKLSSIARDFGKCSSNISVIVNRKSWAKFK